MIAAAAADIYLYILVNSGSASQIIWLLSP